MAPRMRDLGIDDLERYYAAYDATSRTLTALTEAYEMRRLTPGVTEDELNQIRVNVTWLAAEKTKLDERRVAFESNLAAITPPTDPDVQRVSELARRVDAAIAQSNALDQGFAVARDVVQVFNQIHGQA